VPPASGKILVIRGGAIGDFILTLPALAAVRQNFPGVRLELLGYPRVTALALAAGLVDQVHSIEARALASFFAKGCPLPSSLAGFFGSFALIISYLYDPDLIFQENIALCSAAQFIAGPHRPDEAGSLHATDTFLQPLRRLAIFDADPNPHLRLPHDHALLLAEGLGAKLPASPESPATVHWLALHPGSGSERKNWPEANWAELLRCLAAETGCCFLLVGGEAEGDRLERLASLVPADRHRVARSRPLPELAVLLQQCEAFLGHDSGISHLAAALGLPGLVLWGGTAQQIWRPRNERMAILSSSKGLSALPVPEVFKAVRELVEPATLDWAPHSFRSGKSAR
jgi:heptosyltransferase-3